MMLWGYFPISLLKLLWSVLGRHWQWFSSWSYSTFLTIHRASRPLWNCKGEVFKINIWFERKKRLSLEICGYLKYWDHGKLKECTRTTKGLCVVFYILETRTISNISFCSQCLILSELSIFFIALFEIGHWKWHILIHVTDYYSAAAL